MQALMSSRVSLWTVGILVFLSALFRVESPSAADPEPMRGEIDSVAREIVEIQEQLGGSIVESQLNTPREGGLDNALEGICSASEKKLSEDPVVALREVSLRLDLTAHQLELKDLYQQADALRDLAQKFRLDARRLKHSKESVHTDQPDTGP